MCTGALIGPHPALLANQGSEPECVRALIGPHPVLLANQGRSLNVYRCIDWAASSVTSKSGVGA